MYNYLQDQNLGSVFGPRGVWNMAKIVVKGQRSLTFWQPLDKIYFLIVCHC